MDREAEESFERSDDCEEWAQKGRATTVPMHIWSRRSLRLETPKHINAMIIAAMDCRCDEFESIHLVKMRSGLSLLIFKFIQLTFTSECLNSLFITFLTTNGSLDILSTAFDHI